MKMDIPDQILALFDKARVGGGMPVLLFGMEQAGKSYVIDRVIEKLQIEGVVCLKSQPQRAVDDYLVFSELLRQAEVFKKRYIKSGILSYLAKDDMPVTKKTSIFVKLISSFAIISATIPIFIAIEDLDKLETPSLDLFYRLSRYVSNKKILLVGTVSEKKHDRSFSEFYMKMKKLENYHELHIPLLTHEKILKFLESLGYTIPKYIAENICTYTQCRPGLIVKLLKLYELRGYIDKDKVWIGPFYGTRNLAPVSLVESEQSTSALSPEQKEVLEAAALIGQTFTFDSLLAILPYDELQLSELLDTLIFDGFIIEKDEMVFNFISEQLRVQIYKKTPSEKKRRWHKKYGEWLEKHVPEDIHGLSTHFYNAGMYRKAHKYLIQAVEWHFNNYTYNGALNELEKLRKFLGDKDFIILYYFARAYKGLGKLNKSIQYLKKSLEYASQEQKLDVYNALVEVYILMGKLNTALSELRVAIRFSKENNLKIGALIYLYLGIIYRFKSNFKHAKDCLNRALKIANSENAWLVVGDAHKELGNVYYLEQKLDIAESEYNEAIKYYTKVGNIEGLARTYNNLGNIYVYTNVLKAIQYYEKNLYFSDIAGDELALARTYTNLAILYFDNTKFSLYWKYIKEAERISERIGEYYAKELILSSQAEYYILKAEFDTARTYYQKSAHIAHTVSGDQWEYYLITAYLEQLKVLISGTVRWEQFEKIFEQLQAISADNGLTATLMLKIDLNILSLNFSTALDLTTELLKNAKQQNRLELLVYAYSHKCYLDILSGHDEHIIEFYEHLNKIETEAGRSSIDHQILHVCYNYLKDKNTAKTEFTRVLSMLKMHKLPYIEALLLLYYGVLLWRHEKDSTILNQALEIFKKYHIQAYVNIIDKVILKKEDKSVQSNTTR